MQNDLEALSPDNGEVVACLQDMLGDLSSEACKKQVRHARSR